MLCNDLNSVVIDPVLDLHTNPQNFCCTIPAPFVMSQGRSKCPYHMTSSYFHKDNSLITSYTKGHEHIHTRIFNQLNHPKEVFSNRLGISYLVTYVANGNPKQAGKLVKKGIMLIKRLFLSFPSI